MRTITRDEAMAAKKRADSNSYTTTCVTHYYGTPHILLRVRTGHCGGVDWDDVGIVDAATAAALVKAGAKDLRKSTE